MAGSTLDSLLSLLGPDKHSAAVEYRKLHQRLSRFFDWNGMADPEGMADEAIDRLGKKANEEDAGAPIRNASAFALGIARLLVLEENRKEQQKNEAVRNWEQHKPHFDPDAETMDKALQHCLAIMPPERRMVVERYYTFNAGEKATVHQRLARKLGVTANALRNRALRARQDLESCMVKFLKERGSDVLSRLRTLR